MLAHWRLLIIVIVRDALRLCSGQNKNRAEPGWMVWRKFSIFAFVQTGKSSWAGLNGI